jgi:anti-sigma factor RsiW
MTTALTENEKLLLRHLDAPLDATEAERLSRLLREDQALQAQQRAYLAVREQLARKAPETFGLFFADRVIRQLKKRTEEIDYLILFFFRKYQVVALGIFVALLTANLFLTDQFSVASVFGLEQETIEDFISIDLYENLNP